jgi:hypothetical protein
MFTETEHEVNVLYRLEKLRTFLYSRGLEKEAGMLNSLAKYAHQAQEESLDNDTLSIIDLIGNYETGVVIKDKMPQRIISYSDDAQAGENFTDDGDEIGKKAHGLFDVPYGSPDGNVSHRPRDKYEQQDKEVAESFFGAESNIDTEESFPPANIERCNNKPINILDQTEFEDFFSFLNSTDGKLKRKKYKDLGL